MSDHDDADFDEALYLASNPDVARAFDAGLVPTGRVHWLEAGRREFGAGARPTLVEIVGKTPVAPRPVAPTFDASLYLDMNVDLRTVFGGDLEAARHHWAEHGSLEGRFGAGDAPHRARTPDLAGLLARPFGVDLFMSVEENEPCSVAARRLLVALRRCSIPVVIHPFVERDDIPAVSASERARAPACRVSLIAASPQILRRLLRAYPDGHFDSSYVIGFWTSLGFAPHLPDYPTFGAVDEVWVASEDLRGRLASVAPVPVRFLRLPGRKLLRRTEARARLGVTPDAICIMVDADLVGDGQGGLQPPDHLSAVVNAWRVAVRPARSHLLLVRANPRSVAAACSAVGNLRHAIVISDQRQDGCSLILAACDAMIASPGLDTDIADAREAARVVIAPTGRDLESFLAGQTRAAMPTARRANGSVRELLAALQLDVPVPRFATYLGRSRHASLPVPARPRVGPPVHSLPVLSILLDARGSSSADIARIAASLTAGSHPFWELCIAGLRDTGYTRDRLPQDPRIRLVAGRPPTSPGAAWNEAASCATGSYAVLARSTNEALAAAAALAALVPHLATGDPAILLAGESSGGAPLSDRIEAGGPVVRPVALSLSLFRAVGGLREQTGPAAEYDLLLRIRQAGGALSVCPGADAPVRDPDPPDADEAGRLVLMAHLQVTAGPLAYAEQGRRPFTYWVRTHAARRLVPTIVIQETAALTASNLGQDVRLVRTGGPFLTGETDLPTEHIILLDRAIGQMNLGALMALLEFVQNQEIGAVGARILNADGTLHHAGLLLRPDGSLYAPGRGQPDDPSGPTPFAATVTNPDAVGGGVLATRRSILLQAGGFDRSLLGAGGVTFDLLAADLCLRVARDFSLRTTYTPFAVFRHAVASPSEDGPAAPPTQAELLFRHRWAS